MNEHGIWLTASGREVSLIDLRMSLTWRGLMAGTRGKATEHRRRNNHRVFMEQMREEFDVERAALVLDEGLPALPPFQWMALFEGEPIKSNGDFWQSQLSICWFTPVIPSSIDEMIKGHLTKLVWEDVAEDFDASY